MLSISKIEFCDLGEQPENSKGGTGTEVPGPGCWSSHGEQPSLYLLWRGPLSLPYFWDAMFFFSSALLQPLSASCLPQCGILSQPAPSSTFRKGRQNSIKFWGSCSCGCGRFKETDTGKKKKKKKKPINIEQRTFKKSKEAGQKQTRSGHV